MKENDPIKNLTEATPERHPSKKNSCSCPSVRTNREARPPGCPRPSSAQRAVAHCREGRHRKRQPSWRPPAHQALLARRRASVAGSLSPATFASAAAHCGSGEPDSGLETDLWSKRWSAGSWREYLAAGETEAEVTAIRRCTHTGRPLGTAEFVCSLEHATLRRLAPQKGGRPGKVRDHRGQRVLAFEN